MSQIYVIIFLTLFFSLFSTTIGGNNFLSNNDTQTYIVSIQNNLKPTEFSNIEEWYKLILRKTNSNPSESLIHVYNTVFHGFSARLRAEQANSLRTRPEVINIFQDKIYQLHTTRTPHFLGLDTYHRPLSGLLNESDLGSNVVVGVLDTGIWPESPSFNDIGLGPVPAHFKGVCEGGVNFSASLCNKKIVGVRTFSTWSTIKGEPHSARDDAGHGTHTASIIAGRLVQNASFFGYAKGESSGIAPKARLAIYKVCGAVGCFGSDVMAGTDKAVEDGVDVISLSLGGDPSRYTEDSIALSAFGALQHGVFVSGAAGNSGPYLSDLSNSAPWITCVGASTIDRTFPADIILDNGVVLTGTSLYTGEDPLPKNKTFPLVFFSSDEPKKYCEPDSFDEKEVKGKIVVCYPGMSVSNVRKGVAVKTAGGVGIIVALNDPLIGENDTLLSEPYLIPGLTIPYRETKKLLKYISKKQVTEARLVFRGTRIGEKPAPVVSSFSSRGPNTVSKYILKPDMTAPGVDILAAWPNNIPPSITVSEDNRRSGFNILSGTSMSCPHVSGLAALLKGAHSGWTPAMIRSALMTTAYTGHHKARKTSTEKNNKDQIPAEYWVTGAGHVNPEKANHPGLVYDIGEEDYIQFLCNSGYNASEMQTIVKRQVKCEEKPKMNGWDLNYPALVVPEGKKIVRVLTNVENNARIYRAKVVRPEGMSVSVSPVELRFEAKQKLGFSVKVTSLKDHHHQGVSKIQRSGSLTWSDGRRNVTIPLIIFDY